MTAPRLYTLKDVAEMLGVTVMTVNNLRKGAYLGTDKKMHFYNNKFPQALKIGRSVRFRAAEVDRWINAQVASC